MANAMIEPRVLKIYSSMSERPSARDFGQGLCVAAGSLFASDGSAWTKSGDAVFSSLAEFTTLGGASAYGVGPVWIAGAQYWCDGGALSQAGGFYPNATLMQGNEITDTLSNYTLTGSVSEDASVYAASTKTIKLNSTAGSGNSRIQRDKTITFINDAVNSPLLLSFYIPAIDAADSNQTAMEVWLSNGTALSGTNRSQVQLLNFASTGWNTVPVEKAVTATNPFARPAIQNGTAAFNWASALGSFRLDVTGSTTDRVRNWNAFFDGYRERPKVCLTFDDNRDTGYTIGYTEARNRNLKTSHFLIFDLIGTATYATLAQLQQMQKDPSVYLGLHGQFRFDGAGSGAGRTPATEIKRNVDGLKALGLSDCKYMAWPEGQYYPPDMSVISAAQNAGVVAARTTINQHQIFYTHEPMLLRGISLNNTVTLAQAKLAVDYAISWGCSVCFYAHKFGAAADAETWVTADYTSLLDYIATKRSLGLIDDATFPEYARYGNQLKINK